ncbi:MAG TPA: ROK family protein [Rubrobacteraceae bacterium]|nr:ROK family protein [Rubrobacteraceae bacterium]
MKAIGVDVGGTKIAAAVVTRNGKILAETRYPSSGPRERLLSSIARAINDVRDGHDDIGGVCLAVPGFVMSAENKVVFAPNLHTIEGVRLKDEIGQRTDLNITVENDANAAAWGEFKFGAGSEVDHLVFLTLGTGIGGGVISHGILLRGAQGAGGELGHITIQAEDGPLCGCGNYGCLEPLASGTSITRRAREVASEHPQSALGQIAVNRNVLGEDVTELAQQGDELAISVLEETGRWLGVGLAGFVNIFNPDVIAIGGGASRAGELILGPAREEMRRRSQSPSRDLVEIKEATLGPESGVLGAAALARNEKGEYVLGA